MLTWPGAPDSEFPKFVVILFAVNFCGFILQLKNRPKINIVNNPIDKLLLATGLITTLSWMLNGFPLSGLIGLAYRYQGLITIWTFIIFYFLSKQIVRWQQSLWLIPWLVRFIFIIYLLGYRSFQGNPNFLAAYMSLLFCLLPPRPLILAEGGLQTLALIWLSASRFGLLSWLFGLPRLFPPKFRFLIPLLCLGFIFLFPQKSISHFDNRLVIWSKTVQMVSLSPILGFGPENFETGFQKVLGPNDFDLKNVRVDRSHNLFLDILVNTGIIGLVVWLLLFYHLAVRSGIFIIPLLAFIIIGSLNVLSLNSWMIFYLLAALISSGRTSGSPPPPTPFGKLTDLTYQQYYPFHPLPLNISSGVK